MNVVIWTTPDAELRVVPRQLTGIAVWGDVLRPARGSHTVHGSATRTGPELTDLAHKLVVPQWDWAGS